jgi:hypothetical protein
MGFGLGLLPSIERLSTKKKKKDLKIYKKLF